LISKLKILIGCEESGIVTQNFRDLGFTAFSCDILPTSGNHPEWHIQGDIFEVLSAIKFYTQNFDSHYINGWDGMICFPPCTHLAVSGAAHFEQKRKDGRQQEGIDFFLKLANADIKHIAIENPVGIMSSLYRKPDQVIQPYYFGDEAQKTTCLWLKNLPPLYHNDKPNLFDSEVTHSGKGEFIELEYKGGVKKKTSKWEYECAKSPIEIRAKLRSKTFPGIAKAMATQWGAYLLNIENLSE